MDDTTLRTYGTLLYHFANAILQTMDKDYGDGYQFPLGIQQQAAGTILLKALNSNSANVVAAFHDFIKPILFVECDKEVASDYTKWSEVLECLIAVFFVRNDGNFRQPKDCTQTFAQLVYLIRGSVLFEGYQHVAEHGNQLAP